MASFFRTIDRLAAAATAAALLVFARIDHAKDAHAAGLELRPTELLINGQPGAAQLKLERHQAGSVGPAVEEASRFGPASASRNVAIAGGEIPSG